VSETRRDELDQLKNVQRGRLRIDARRWFVAKLAQREYAEQISQELLGPDGGPIGTEAG